MGSNKKSLSYEEEAHYSDASESGDDAGTKDSGWQSSDGSIVNEPTAGGSNDWLFIPATSCLANYTMRGHKVTCPHPLAATCPKHARKVANGTLDRGHAGHYKAKFFKTGRLAGHATTSHQTPKRFAITQKLFAAQRDEAAAALSSHPTYAATSAAIELESKLSTPKNLKPPPSGSTATPTSAILKSRYLADMNFPAAPTLEAYNASRSNPADDNEYFDDEDDDEDDEDEEDEDEDVNGDDDDDEEEEEDEDDDDDEDGDEEDAALSLQSQRMKAILHADFAKAQRKKKNKAQSKKRSTLAKREAAVATKAAAAKKAHAKRIKAFQEQQEHLFLRKQLKEMKKRKARQEKPSNKKLRRLIAELAAKSDSSNLFDDDDDDDDDNDDDSDDDDDDDDEDEDYEDPILTPIRSRPATRRRPNSKPTAKPKPPALSAAASRLRKQTKAHMLAAAAARSELEAAAAAEAVADAEDAAARTRFSIAASAPVQAQAHVPLPDSHPQFWAVTVGLDPGIHYGPFPSIRHLVHGYPNASYAGFSTQDEAKAHLATAPGMLRATATEYIPKNPAGAVTPDPSLGNDNELYGHPLQSDPQLTTAFSPVGFPPVSAEQLGASVPDFSKILSTGASTSSETVSDVNLLARAFEDIGRATSTNSNGVVKDRNWPEKTNNFLSHIKSEEQLVDALVKSVELQQRSQEAAIRNFEATFRDAGWPGDYVELWSSVSLFARLARESSDMMIRLLLHLNIVYIKSGFPAAKIEIQHFSDKLGLLRSSAPGRLTALCQITAFLREAQHAKWNSLYLSASRTNALQQEMAVVQCMAAMPACPIINTSCAHCKSSHHAGGRNMCWWKSLPPAEAKKAAAALEK